MATHIGPAKAAEQLIHIALDSLEDSTGIQGRILLHEEPSSDGRIELEADGRRYPYRTERRQYVDRQPLLAQVKNQLEALAEPGLLVVPHMTATMAARCRKLELQFIDAAGNAYLKGPGLYVYVSGQKPSRLNRSLRTDASLGTPAAMRMVFALLCHPALVQAPYREIVEYAGISLGAVGKIFDQLQRRGFVTVADKLRGRRLTDTARLLDEWAALYPSGLRPKLRPQRFRAPTPHWWEAFDPPASLVWWGGEVAADKLTNYLVPATYALYVAPAAMRDVSRQIISQYRLRPDPEGDIELLEAFWRFPTTAPQGDVAPPVVVYADLLASLDSRNLEVAQLIRKDMLDDAHRQA